MMSSDLKNINLKFWREKNAVVTICVAGYILQISRTLQNVTSRTLTQYSLKFFETNSKRDKIMSKEQKYYFSSNIHKILGGYILRTV